jgi:hypothetical protein
MSKQELTAEFTWDVCVIDRKDKNRTHQHTRISGYPDVTAVQRFAARNWKHLEFVSATCVNPQIQTEPPKPVVDPDGSLNLQLPETSPTPTGGQSKSRREQPQS